MLTVMFSLPTHADHNSVIDTTTTTLFEFQQAIDPRVKDSQSIVEYAEQWTVDGHSSKTDIACNGTYISSIGN